MKLFGWKSAGRAVARPVLSHGFSTWGTTDWPRSYEAQLRELYLGNAVAQRAVRLVRAAGRWRSSIAPARRRRGWRATG